MLKKHCFIWLLSNYNGSWFELCWNPDCSCIFKTLPCSYQLVISSDDSTRDSNAGLPTRKSCQLPQGANYKGSVFFPTDLLLIVIALCTLVHCTKRKAQRKVGQLFIFAPWPVSRFLVIFPNNKNR